MARGGKRKGAGRKTNKAKGLPDLVSVSTKVTTDGKEFLEGMAAKKGTTVSVIITEALKAAVRGFKKHNKSLDQFRGTG